MYDFFTLIGMPRQYDLDPAALEQRYFVLQRQYHPDRAVTVNPQDRQRMMQQSIDINLAYNTLKDPLRRAQHLLALHGIKLEGEDAVKPVARILSEAMEWRETLEEADSHKAIEQLYRTVFKERDACRERLSGQCAAKEWQEAAQTCLRFGYLEKLLEEIQQKNDQLKKAT